MIAILVIITSLFNYIDIGAAFTLVDSRTGYCLTAMGSENGAAIQIRDCNGSPSQDFYFNGWTGFRWRKMKSRLGNNKCLNMHVDDYRSNVNNGKVQLWDCNGINQFTYLWRFAGGKIRNQNSKCLDASAPDRGATVHMFSCHNGDNQWWGINGFGNTLQEGQTLHEGYMLYSKEAPRKYALQMQYDGNLVLYTRDRSIWASNSVGGLGRYRLVLQGDNNLVIYTGNRATWSSQTSRKGKQDGKSRLLLQGDGNLVLYDSAGGFVWASHTSQNANAAPLNIISNFVGEDIAVADPPLEFKILSVSLFALSIALLVWNCYVFYQQKQINKYQL